MELAASRIGLPARMQVLPSWLTPIVAVFQPLLGETIEMRFQWDRPHLVDTTKFRSRFWSDATRFEAGLDANIAFLKQRPLAS